MQDDLSSPPAGGSRFEGLKAFQQAVRSAVHDAAAGGAREIWMVDADFEDWPLGEAEFVHDLSLWALHSHVGHCTLIAASFERFHALARWLEWRKTWSHKVRCLQAPDEWLQRMPSLLFVPGQVAVERQDLTHHRGSVSHAAAQWAACRDRCDAISQRSTETLPVTTLGL